MSQSKFRKILPLDLRDVRGDINPPKSTVPKMVMINPAEVYIDERYQRSPSEKSVRIIHNMIKNWDWAAFTPPQLIKDDKGAYHALDGQHTCIAAASHPDITEIPAFLAEADTLKTRATAFVTRNTKRTAVTPYAAFKAKLSAEDPNAISLEAACMRAKVTLTDVMPSAVDPDKTYCMATNTALAITNRKGPLIMRKIFDVCKESGISPIPAMYLLALEDLVGSNSSSKHETEIDLDGLALAVRDYPLEKLNSDIAYQSTIQKGTPKRNIASKLILNHYRDLMGI